MKKKYTIIVIIIAILLATFLIFKKNSKNEEIVTVPVNKGEFVISVTTTGELEAKNSVKIYGPQGLRKLQVYKIKVNDLVPEGTLVDSGEYVAQLDKSDVLDKLKDLENEVEKFKSQFIKTKLDTTLELRRLRDELQNLKYMMEEREIELEQSKYEPPATIRQAKISLEKAERDYMQTKSNYNLELEKAVANMAEVQASLSQNERKLSNTVKILDDFTIYAPQSGMVIYERNWEGTVKTGSTINVWSNVVATLPDLSEMISKTYVNEIDISKIHKDQEVRVSIDAFPDKEFSALVTEVANIGQQMQSSDAKVFEVKIELKEADAILRPAMTTKNEIITDVFQDEIYIPLEAVFIDNGKKYVFKSSGNRLRKQEVITGKSNDNEIIIQKGLTADDKVSLTIPQNADKMSIQELD